MPNINTTVDVPAPPEKVWELFSNPNRFEEWLTIHAKWQTEPPAEIGVGTQMTEVITMMGMANKIAWTVEEYEPPRRVKISGTGLAGVKTVFELGVAPSDAGSRVSIDAEFTGQLIVGPLGAAVEKDAKKNLDASLAKLAELVS